MNVHFKKEKVSLEKVYCAFVLLKIYPGIKHVCEDTKKRGILYKTTEISKKNE